jgi:hypothetical protein
LKVWSDALRGDLVVRLDSVGKLAPNTRENLAHTGLADTKDLTDLRALQALDVNHAEHILLTLRQAGDRAAKHLLTLTCEQCTLRIKIILGSSDRVTDLERE